MTLKTRFAPSPTGYLHVGGARTALFSWLHARKHGGKFVLRIEDTDLQRSTAESINAILEGMTWLGLEYDEGPLYQTQRFDRYNEVIQQLLDSGQAYRCNCSKERLDSLREEQMQQKLKPRYDGHCRGKDIGADEPHVVRFCNPSSGSVVVDDLVRGRIVFSNEELDDLIIRRTDGSPTYNLTVVVDDSDMGITQVIRGDDHLNNTPRQINMFDAMGVEPPVFAHLPMILGPDGAKLSKRHGAVDIREYRAEGYLAVAMLNYLVRLGWSHGDQEIFSLSEMIDLFDITDVNQSASAFNPEKLLWTNQQHIIASPPEQLGEALVPYLRETGLDPDEGPDPVEVAAGFHERAETLSQMAASARYCYEDFEAIDPPAAKKHLRPVTLAPLRAVRDRLADLPDWTTASISTAVEETAESFEIKMGKLGQPLRVAVTGGSVSPPIDVTVYLVGRERTLQRLDQAIGFIEARAAGEQP